MAVKDYRFIFCNLQVRILCYQPNFHTPYQSISEHEKLKKIFSFIKEYKIFFVFYIFLLILLIPIFQNFEREHERISGTLVSIDPNIGTSKHKSKITKHYNAIFHFEEYGDRRVAIQKRTYDEGKKGDVYTFLRKHVYQDAITTLLVIASAIVFSLSFTLTLLIVVCLGLVFLKKNENKIK